ncbi:MAG: hypothetical protein M5U31_14865 [Acidimicrobiia bacterium]|nr:hypothetical protein [Acidimicrobiia bacterium]
MTTRTFRRQKSPVQNHDWGSESGRPRVLLVIDDVTELDAVAEILADAGYDVATCEGPDKSARKKCDLLASGTCALVERTDVVYYGLRMTDADHREVVASLAQRFPDTPVILEAPAPTLERFADLVRGHHLVRFPATRDAVLEAVGSVLDAPAGI